MQVITVSTFGGPEVMQVTDAELPKPGPGEVLVRVLAAGVGPWDTSLRRGGYTGSLPYVPGDTRAVTPRPQLVFQPADLRAVAVTQQPLDLPGEIVGVQADDPHVAVAEAVHGRAGRRAGAGQVHTLHQPAVAERLVVGHGHGVGGNLCREHLGLVVAGGEHPRDRRSARLDQLTWRLWRHGRNLWSRDRRPLTSG
jgi:hypothetical protein